MSISQEMRDEITSNVREDMLNVFDKLFETHKMTVSQVHATLAYMLGYTIGSDENLDEDRVCILATCYGTYMHDAAHSIHDIEKEKDTNVIPLKRKKPKPTSH